MTDGLWKYHLKKAHQVELPEVGLPEGIRGHHSQNILTHQLMPTTIF